MTPSHRLRVLRLAQWGGIVLLLPFQAPAGADTETGNDASAGEAEEAAVEAPEAAAETETADDGKKKSLIERIRDNRAREMPGNQRIGWERRRQVPYVRNGGNLNRKETAVVGYADADLFPPALMVGIQRGIYYWLTVGLDVGGDVGVFQAILRIKQEMARTRGTNFFFWGWHIRTGYKYVEIDSRDTNPDLYFQDNSWILTFENTFAFRFGNHRRRVIYVNTVVYADFDLTGRGWQTDAYLFPATLGYEMIVGRQWNFFIEAGVILSLNGWETEAGVIQPDGDLFPSGQIGFAYRFGGVRTLLPEDWRDPSAPPMR